MRKRVLTLWDGKVFLALVVLMSCLIAAVALRVTEGTAAEWNGDKN